MQDMSSNLSVNGARGSSPELQQPMIVKDRSQTSYPAGNYGELDSEEYHNGYGRNTTSAA